MLYMFWAVFPPIIRSSKFKTVHTTAGRIPDGVCTVLNFELLMMDGKTARNMSSIDSKKEHCIVLHLVGYTRNNDFITC
jgi:hypothetical protein